MAPNAYLCFLCVDKADPIPKETASKLLDWMSIDVQLYDWANNTLWREIAREDDFEAELSFYKNLNNLVGAYCKASVLLYRVSTTSSSLPLVV